MGRALSSRFFRQWQLVIFLVGLVLIFATLTFGTSPGAAPSLTPTPTPTPSPTHTFVSVFSSLFGYLGQMSSSLSLFVAVALVLAGTSWWFLCVFTSKSIQQEDIRRMVRYCYTFTLVSILVSVSPPIIFVTLPPSWIDTLYRAAFESPLGIVRGCVHVPKNGDQTWELACRSKEDKYADQWIVNIGGSVLLRCKYGKDCPGAVTNLACVAAACLASASQSVQGPTPIPTIVPTPLSIPAPTVSPSPAPTPAPPLYLGTKTLRRGSADRAAVTKLQQRIKDLGFKLDNAGGVGSFGRRTERAVRDFQKSASLPVSGIADPATLRALETFTPPSTPTPSPASPAAATVSPSPKPRPAGEHLQESIRFPAVTIHGGLAVPWYFITLALMGAAISIARKVPEYQRRVFFNPVQKLEIQNEEEIPLSPQVVREYLVFQILQFLYAPFVAIVAYYAVKPAGAAGSVALGFVSGFSSPAVLLLINGALVS